MNDTKTIGNSFVVNITHSALFLPLLVAGTLASYFGVNWVNHFLMWSAVGIVFYHSCLFTVSLSNVMTYGFANYRLFIYAFHILYGSFIFASTFDTQKSPVKLGIIGIAVVGFFSHIGLFLQKYYNS